MLYLTDQNESNDLLGACTQIEAFVQTVNSNAHNDRIPLQTTDALIEPLPYSAKANTTEVKHS
jgi:hypothetical protein